MEKENYEKPDDFLCAVERRVGCTINDHPDPENRGGEREQHPDEADTGKKAEELGQMIRNHGHEHQTTVLGQAMIFCRDAPASC